MKHIYFFSIILFFYFQPANAQNRPEKMPVYPGCEQAVKKMPCFKEKVLNFITENFNSGLIDEIKKETTVSMLIMFVIDENGKPVDIMIKSGYPSLNDEMKRVIKKLPAVKPAESGGETVKMQYELPVIFETGNKK
jgi:hypothetical protein